MRDIMGLMKQAQAMQQKLQDAQAELETSKSTARPAAASWSSKCRARAPKAINIDPSLMNPDEKEILEDLIVAAMNDARGKSRSGRAGPHGRSDQGPAASARPEDVLRASWRNPLPALRSSA